MSIEQNQTIASSKNYGDIDSMVKALANHVDFDAIKTIYDIGSRDALESQQFTSVFPTAKIFTFEPNPEAFKICIENAKGYPNISVHQVAMSNTNGEIDFFAADLEKSRDANLGISSMFKLMNE